MGVVPATTAVICGKLRVGLTEEEIELLGRGQGIAKAGYRDLGVLLATGGSGGTTVAASIALAEMAGIPVFVTGGIGGVHRGATSTFDVSNDLFMISRTDVATAVSYTHLDVYKRQDLSRPRKPVLLLSGSMLILQAL